MSAELPLDDALERLTEADAAWAPVVDGGVEVGHLTTRDVVTTYKDALRRGMRRTQALTPETSLFKVRLDAASPLAGATLSAVRFPPDTLVVAISRDGQTIFPRASTRLEAGDVVRILASPASEAAVRAFLTVRTDEERR